MTTASKYVFALWGDDLAETLLAEPLRNRLAGLGVERLQVNIDDADVESATLRISTYDDPVRAIVSVWSSADITGVEAALADAGSRIAGWRVDERRPIEPPTIVDGQRADALVNVVLIRRPEDMSREDWLDRWLVHHTPVAIETQSTFGYVQNVVAEPLRAGSPAVDGIIEELFPPAAISDLHAVFDSNGDNELLTLRLNAMLASITTFGANENLDVIPTSRYVFDLTTR